MKLPCFSKQQQTVLGNLAILQRIGLTRHPSKPNPAYVQGRVAKETLTGKKTQM